MYFGICQAKENNKKERMNKIVSILELRIVVKADRNADCFIYSVN